MDKLLKPTNYSDLDLDFPQWDSFIEAARKSVFFPFFQAGMQGQTWDDITPEDRDGMLTGFLRAHEKIFGYTAFELTTGEEPSSNGLWTMVHKKRDGALGDVEGEINIPLIGNEDSLQLLVYSMARNFLVTRYTRDDEKYAHLTKDLEQFNTDRIGLNDELFRLGLFPMPDELETWLDRASSRYALQAASYVSGQLFGKPNISPKILELLQTDYMGEHRDILAMVENTQDQLGDDVVDLHLELWKTRAQNYIDVIANNPDQHDPMEALRVLSVAKRDGIVLKEPAALQALLARDPNLKAMSVCGREEALNYVMKHSASTFEKLSPEARLHVIDAFGEQTKLSPMQRKSCDMAAQELLRSWPLSPSFLAYYSALIKQMAPELRGNKELCELGKEWVMGADDDTRFSFLILLNEQVSKFFDIETVPLVPYSQEWPEEKEDDELKGWIHKDLGFASKEASATRLKEEYGLILPEHLEGKKIIGLNIHPCTQLITQRSPMPASTVVVHEIGHHVVNKLDLMHFLGDLPKSDSRYEQAVQYRAANEKDFIDTRLRNDFSRALYPLIQTEKFEYWLMDEFERSQPFSFLGLDR